MNRKTLSRLALVASATTVAGLALPVLAATSATAAEPTSLAFDQSTASTQYVREAGTATFTVDLGPAGTTAANGVYYDIYSGPDTPSAQAPLNGTTCGNAATVNGVTQYTCAITVGATPGIDDVHFYVPATAGAPFATGDTHVDGTISVAGPVNTVTITPTTAHTSQGVYSTYSVSAADSAGRPEPGVAVTVTASQANAADGDLSVVAGGSPGTTTGTADPVTPTPATPGTATATVTTGDGTGTSTAGSTTFSVASEVAGTVNLTATTPVEAGETVGKSGTATLTVDPGTATAVTSVVLSPATAKAFASPTTDGQRSVTELVTLTNAQGDPVAGVGAGNATTVGLIGTVTGFDAGRTVTFTNTDPTKAGAAVTDANGQIEATYTTLVTAVNGAHSGTDTLSVYVNQAAQPTGTATIAINPEPAGTNLSDDYSFRGADSTIGAQLNQTTTNVTFTLDGPTDPSGYTVQESTGGTATAANVSVSPTLGSTGTDGTVTFAVTNSAPANNTTVTLKATLTADPSVTDTVTIDYTTAVADEVVITPYAATDATDHTSASYSAAVYDQFGNPVASTATAPLTYSWTVGTGGEFPSRNNPTFNPTASGTGPTFSYTDEGSATEDGADVVTVTVNGVSDSVTQFWVTGTATASHAAINVNDPYNGAHFTNTAGTFSPTGFVGTNGAEISSSYTATTASPNAPEDLVPVQVAVADANGNPLYGDSVSFSSSGVGQLFGFNPLTDTYTALGTSGTALVEDCGTFFEEESNATDYCGNGNPEGAFGEETGFATIFAASTAPGAETVTATVDGQTSTGTINYSGQYIPLNPTRILDTRSGVGGLETGAGSTAPVGSIAPNTLYQFEVSNSSAPTNADAYVFNVAAIGATAAGNLRIAPTCDEEEDGALQADAPPIESGVPQTALITYQPGKDVSNGVVLPNDGCDDFAVYSDNARVNIAIDLEGYYSSDGAFESDGTERLADTRTTNGGGTVAANTSRSFQISGNDIPAGAKAVAINVTAVLPTTVGNLRVYPDGAAVPTTANIAYIPGVTKSAFVVVPLPADGKIDVYSDGSPVNVVIDGFGYYNDSSNLTLLGTGATLGAPVRVLDTRPAVIAANTPYTFAVGGQDGIPADAQAVLVSVTAVHAATSTGSGNLRLYPAGDAVPTVATINYVSKTADVANFAIVKLGTGGQLSLYSDGSPISATVDVLGYVPANS